MRIFIAGATGVLGRSLVPNLLNHGHTVIGTSSRDVRIRELKRLGAQAVLMNGLDRDSVFSAISSSTPDVVVNQMTSLAKVRNYRNFDREFALTNRLRVEGTSHLLAASRHFGVRKAVVQSFAGWPFEQSGRHANSEAADFEPSVPRTMRASKRAIQTMERSVLSSDLPVGVVLRYGYVYGPGTAFDVDGDISKAVRKRTFPIIGAGTAIWSFIHVEDAAEATRLAIERATSGIYNIVDDNPSCLAEWLPAFAAILGAKAPMRVPPWLGRLFAGESGVYLMTRARGATNAKAKQSLAWKLAYPDWYTGFETMYSSGCR